MAKCKSTRKYPYGGVTKRENPSPLDVLTDFKMDQAENMMEAENSPLVKTLRALSAITGSIGKSMVSKGMGSGGESGGGFDFSNLFNKGSGTGMDISMDESVMQEGDNSLNKFEGGGTIGKTPSVATSVAPKDFMTALFTVSGIDVNSDSFKGLSETSKGDLFKHLLEKKENPTDEEKSQLQKYKESQILKVIQETNSLPYALGGEVKSQNKALPVEDFMNSLFITSGVDINSKEYKELSESGKGEMYQFLLEKKKNPTEEEKLQLQQYKESQIMKAIQEINNSSFALGGEVKGQKAVSRKTTGKSSSKTILPGFGSFNTAFNIPVEVEGGETAFLPDNSTLKFKGPNHEQGGIETLLPEETDIFSKKIKIRDPRNKKLLSMAEREENRAKREKKLQKKLDENSSDLFAKQALERITGNNTKEREKDKAYQSKMRLALALVSDANGEENPLKAEFGLEDIMGLISKNAGNITSLYGDYYSTFAPMKNTKKAFQNRLENVDFTEGFGDKEMATMEQMFGNLSGEKEKALEDVERQRITGASNTRRMSRSLNEMRTADFMSDTAANLQSSKVRSEFTKQENDLLGQKLNLQGSIDTVKMQGKQGKYLADQEDLANLFAQLAQDIATKGEGMQNIGKDINDVGENKMMEDLINQLSAYGFKIINGKVVKTGESKQQV